MSKTFKKTSAKCVVILFKWAIPVLIIFGLYLAGVGRNIWSRFDLSSSGGDSKRSVEKSVPKLNIEVGNEVLEALDKARHAAEDYAKKELDSWSSDVMTRADENFLNDYFGFVQTKCREGTALFQTILNKAHLSEKTAEDKIKHELESKISSQVIRPEVSGARIKNITDKAIETYNSILDERFSKIREEHKIPKPAWGEYISKITGMTERAEQASLKDSVTPIPLKAAGGAAVAGTAVAAKPIINFTKNISAKIAAKIGAKTAEKVGEKIVVEGAVKATEKAAGKTAAKAIPGIGWAVAAGVAVWDFVDYKINAKKGKEALRENIQDYLEEVKGELMGPSEDGIMGSVIEYENNIKRNLKQ